MKRKRIWLFICIVALVVSSVYWINIAWAQKLKNKQEITEYYRERLQDLNGVAVDVIINASKRDGTDDKLLSEELTKQLKTDIELELRRYGIKVLTKKEFEKSSGRPELQINMQFMPELLADDYYNCCYSIFHTEDAFLKRNGLESRAICWQSGAAFGKGSLDYIKKCIISVVRSYINDYLAANPKEPEKKRPSLDELLKKANPKDE